MMTHLFKARQQRKKSKEAILQDIGWTFGSLGAEHPSLIAYRHLEFGHCAADPELRDRLARYFEQPEAELFTPDGYAREVSHA